MRLKSCKCCGKPYETDSPDAIFCPDCSAAYHKAAPVRSRVCRQCGATFSGGPRAWYCPDCRILRQREAERKHRRNGTSRPIGSIDRCIRCGREYIVNSARHVYCKDCSEIAVREKDRQQSRQYNAAHKDALYAQKEAARKDRNVCIICGAVYDANTPTVTCSPECAKKLKKLRQDEADIRRGKRKSPAGVKYDSDLPKSGITGVTARHNGRWQATYKRNYIGIFDTIPEAADAINKYKEEHKDD